MASIQGQNCLPSAEANKSVVLSFYQLGLTDHRSRQAFEKYASADMVEHKPDVPLGTRAAVIEFLEQLTGELPKASWEVLRVASEADLVFLHARFTPEPGSQSYAIADVFRLENCKIVEHWDVVAPPRDGQPNPNSRF
jgi:predicted SnoaL-like aldol condensation-catalyzing enzyme